VITLLVLASFVLMGSLLSSIGIYILLFIFVIFALLLLSAMLYEELLLKSCYKDLFNNTNKNIEKMK
ncbi:MAG TPA: hypothetical protein DCY93_00810, partial [Firmicutes bacterium]|nr:hypothetical protein [Bacillota bacterium]